MSAGTDKPASQPLWLQSPDGRAVVLEEGATGQSLDRPERAGWEEPRLAELEPFVQACLSLLPDQPEGGRARTGRLLFVLGAADRFWDLKGLDDGRFGAYSESLLRRFGMSPSQAATLSAALPQLTADPLALSAMIQGGDALQDWILSRDPNVALRLTELIAEWRRA